MTVPRRAITVAVIALTFVCLSAEGATRVGLVSNGVVRAITRPSGDVTLSFIQAGRLSKMPFKEGDEVEAEKVVAYLDDRAERARMVQIKAQSEDLTQIKASQASLDQKKVDLQKLTKAARLMAATELEVEHARLDVRIAELSLSLAEFEHEQALRQLDEAQIRLDQMQLRTPISGVISLSHVDRGESVNGLDDVMRVVQTNPLWIDASIPITEAALVKPGDQLEVTFFAPDPNTWPGRVIYVSPVADAASVTLTVRLEVSNPDHRPAGEQVEVKCAVLRSQK